MIVQYFPTDSLIINDISINFGQSRYLIRSAIDKSYKEENEILQFGERVIHSRRDIYKNIDSGKSFFFLLYSKDDLLTEVEIHSCNQIVIFEIVFNFNDDLDQVAKQLTKHSTRWKKNNGEYLFEDLLMTISNEDKMGGNGNSVSYFYCASDISHLL